MRVTVGMYRVEADKRRAVHASGPSPRLRLRASGACRIGSAMRLADASCAGSGWRTGSWKIIWMSASRRAAAPPHRAAPKSSPPKRTDAAGGFHQPQDGSPDRRLAAAAFADQARAFRHALMVKLTPSTALMVPTRRSTRKPLVTGKCTASRGHREAALQVARSWPDALGCTGEVRFDPKIVGLDIEPARSPMVCSHVSQ